jgi:hypothetical protein
MLTVRHKHWGTEVVFQAAYVIAQPEWDGVLHPDGDMMAVEFYHADHSKAWDPILYGKLYIMNDQGRTVADYYLPGPPEIHADTK